MQKDSQIKLTIISLLTESNQFSLQDAKDIYEWVMDSEEEPESNVTNLTTVN